MIVRCVVTAALLSFALLASTAASAQQRWVEDEAVLAPRSLRLAAGGGLLLMSYPGVSDDRRIIVGGGWNLEAATGLGHNLEVGARLGLRDAEGRAIHSDEAARVLDTETFGTGLGTVANPELRLRWRVLRRGCVETGVEDRLVIPLPGYPDFTAILGAWASLHGGHLLRVDVGLNAAFIWRSFDAGRVLQAAVGLPVQIHASITSGLFARVFATTHYLASTPYTVTHTTVTAGVGIGYRHRACDIHAAVQRFDVFSSDVLQGAVERTGLGLGLSCRLW